MKRSIWIICTLITIFLLAACVDEWKNREYSFAEGFAELKKLDEKYSTSFHDERLNVSMVALEDIDPFQEELEAFREKVKKTNESPDKGAVIDFINIRIKMLLAQKYFLLAKDIGDIGRVSDENGFRCGEAPYILETAEYLNRSYVYGLEVVRDLDRVLYQHRGVEQLQQLIGLGENKTWFYYSPLNSIKNTVRTNTEVIQRICRELVVKT